MKHARSLSLVLCTCLLVSVGFSLPWVVSAWQDSAQSSQVQQYAATPVNQTGPLEHLRLAAHGYNKVSLSQSITHLSLSQAQKAAQAALDAMAELQFDAFPSDLFGDLQRWTLSSVEPFVAVSREITYVTEGKTHSETGDSQGDTGLSQTAEASAAIFWQCSFTGETDSLELILDDETGKMLAFCYTSQPGLVDASSSQDKFTVTPSISLEDTLRMTEFCQQYYNLSAEDFSEPLASFEGNYLLQLKDPQGDQINLSLSADALQVVDLYENKDAQTQYTLAFNCSATQVKQFQS